MTHAAWPAAPRGGGAPLGARRVPRTAPILPLRRALYVDKDGTLVRDVPYNADAVRIALLPHATDALRALAAAGLQPVIVSNQSGLALGRFTAAELAGYLGALRAELARAGVTLLDILVCPHAPAAHGAPACACRKPRPGLLVRAAAQHGLDLAASWMVGDILDDVEAGARAGTRTCLLDVGSETQWRTGPWRTPTVRAQDWREVAHAILACEALRAPQEHAA